MYRLAKYLILKLAALFSLALGIYYYIVFWSLLLLKEIVSFLICTLGSLSFPFGDFFKVFFLCIFCRLSCTKDSQPQDLCLMI